MKIKNKLITALAAVVLVVPVVSFAQTTTPTIASLEAQIQSLVAELQALELQAAQGKASGSVATSTEIEGGSASGSGSGSGWCYTFNSNLGLGSTGSDVQALQGVLQAQGLPVSVTGAYDQQTAAAVTNFQEMFAPKILTPNGLQAGTGYVGKSTRGELNNLLGCVGGNPIILPATSTIPRLPAPCVISPGSQISCAINPIPAPPCDVNSSTTACQPTTGPITVNPPVPCGANSTTTACPPTGNPPPGYMCPGGATPTTGGQCPPLPVPPLPTPVTSTVPCGANSTSVACTPTAE